MKDTNLKVTIVNLAHRIDIFATYLLGHMPLIGKDKLEEELVLQHGVLGNLVVGHGLAELVDLLQQIRANLGHGFEPEFLQHIANIAGGLGLVKAELLDQREFVIKYIQLSTEISFRHRGLHYYIDHLLGNGHVLNKLGKLSLDRLTIGQLEGHGYGFPLQLRNLRADVVQNALEAH